MAFVFPGFVLPSQRSGAEVIYLPINPVVPPAVSATPDYLGSMFLAWLREQGGALDTGHPATETCALEMEKKDPCTTGTCNAPREENI